MSAHELRLGLEFSRIQTKIQNDSKQIDAMVAQGRFVLVQEAEVCCPLTDALMGTSVKLLGSFETREAAEDIHALYVEDFGEESYSILGPKPVMFPEIPDLLTEDPIPF